MESGYDLDELFAICDTFKKQSPSTELFLPENVCIDCESQDLTTDYANGMIICKSCGSIQEESIIDDSPEWNFGQEDAMYGKDPARCGCPINPLLEKSSMSTMIGKGGGSKFWLLRKIHHQNSMDYVERSRYHTFEYIAKITERASLPACITNKAKYYYKELSERKLSRGAVRQGLIACCIMYACKANKVSRSVKEISEMCNIDPIKINSAVKIFTEVMNELIKDECNESTQASDLISRFCNCLNIPHSEQSKIGRIVRDYNTKVEKSKILIGKTPTAVTSGLIYYILVEMGYTINKKSLCENHKISIVTLNKIVNILEQNKEILV